MAQKSKINLYKYLDYRKYLSDYYAAAKKGRTGFSLRNFSKRAGFGSSNIFKVVMDGDRNLTENSLAKFMHGLGLNKGEQEFFRNLVYFTQSKTHEQKDHYFQKLLQCRSFKRLKTMDRHQYEVYSTWYHAVVRELIISKECNASLEKIAEKITPKISKERIVKSVELLEKLGFIKKTADGHWRQSEPVMTSGLECASVTLMNYHKSLLNLVHDELEKIPFEKRDVSALTLGIPKELLPVLKKRVQDFRRDILKLVAAETDAEDVVLLSMQLLPLTKTWGDSDV